MTAPCNPTDLKRRAFKAGDELTHAEVLSLARVAWRNRRDAGAKPTEGPRSLIVRSATLEGVDDDQPEPHPLAPAWRVYGWVAEGLGVDEGAAIRARLDPEELPQRLPSAWQHRAQRTLDQQGPAALQALRVELVAEMGDLEAMGLGSAARATRGALADVDAVLEAHARAHREREEARRKRQALLKRSPGAPERLPEDWPDICYAIPISEVLGRLGASQLRGGWSCPVCNAQTRHKSDRRAAIWVNSKGTAAKCWKCDFTGTGKPTNQVGLVRAALNCTPIEAARWLLGAS